MKKRTQNSINYVRGRIYARHLLESEDSIHHAAYQFDISSTTYKKYINYLQYSPDKSDRELYEKVNALLEARKWT